MKILLTLFVLFFSSSLVADKYICNVKSHIKNNSTTDPNVVEGIPYDDWIDFDNYNILFQKLDDELSMKYLGEEYKDFPVFKLNIIFKDQRYVHGNAINILDIKDSYNIFYV